MVNATNHTRCLQRFECDECCSADKWERLMSRPKA
jgi:hypothetical protein